MIVDQKLLLFLVRGSSGIGEIIMKEFLTKTIRTQKFSDNYRHPLIRNPETQCPLELDRYYPHLKLAFEFQGEQHYAPIYGKAALKQQKKLDRLKRRLAAKLGIRILYLTAGELKFCHLMQKLFKTLGRGTRLVKKPNRTIRRELETKALDYRQGLKGRYPNSKTAFLSDKGAQKCYRREKEK